MSDIGSDSVETDHRGFFHEEITGSRTRVRTPNHQTLAEACYEEEIYRVLIATNAGEAPDEYIGEHPDLINGEVDLEDYPQTFIHPGEPIEGDWEKVRNIHHERVLGDTGELQDTDSYYKWEKERGEATIEASGMAGTLEVEAPSKEAAADVAAGVIYEHGN